MPELPEVETIKNILKTTWLNKTIDHIEVLCPKMIKGDVSAFYSLEHQTLNDIQRKGKFFNFLLFKSPCFTLSSTNGRKVLFIP